MTFRLEYHRAVQRWIPASVALFGLIVLPALFPSNSFAQINGAPASVTSPGFGGHAINGTPPSVTSLGPRGFAPSNHGGFDNRGPFVTQGPIRDGGRNHHRRDRDNGFSPYYGYGMVYAVPVPYAPDSSEAEAEDESDYHGGPTIFDRRGTGGDSYIPPQRDSPAAHARVDADPPAPETPQVPTTLVFKDGHQIEVGNYAIVADTLYDLTPGHPRKIALATLDLPATEKQNDERGVTFQLPASARAN